MFIDASAIVAILAEEEGWERLGRAVETSRLNLTSALAVWEATVALARTNTIPIETAQAVVQRFLAASGAETIPVTAEIGALALEASRRFGRGRHKADLNFGDCFACACARHRGVPLLFKGEDFVHTDIDAA